MLLCFRFSLPLRVLAETDKSSTKIWAENIVEQYILRPEDGIFKDMSLAEFAADYTKNTKYKADADDEVPDTPKESKCGKTFKLKNGKSIRKRNKRAIIRYYNVRQDKDSERYFKNIMRLYLPHTKLDKPVEYATHEEWFYKGMYKFKDGNTQSICDVVNMNMETFERCAHLMEECWEQCKKDSEDQSDAWAAIAPSAEEDRMEQHEEQYELEETAPEYIAEEDVTVSFPETDSQKTEYDFRVTKSNIVEENELTKMIRQMNSQQFEFFMYVRSWCLKLLRNERPEPFFVHLTGSAGCGKSHLVRSIYQLLTKYLTQLDEECKEVVFLSSLTGSAAFNIGGYTLHSLFSIPVNVPKKYKPLKNKKLREFRDRLANIRVLIIDEISMVSKKLLCFIHGRMKQLKGFSESLNAPFGNTSVLAVGDFFQLPSPGSKMICKKSKGWDYSDDLWSLFVLYRLEEIIRQKGDTAFGEALNDVRTRKRKKKTNATANKNSAQQIPYEYEPLSQKTVALLKNRVIKYAPGDPSYPNHAVHLYARRKDVASHNKRILQVLCPNFRKIVAVDLETKNGKTRRLSQPISIDDPKDYQLPELDVSEGARVILKLNLDVRDGLCNAATGTVVKIYDGKMPHGQPEVLYIRFDNERVGRKLKMNTVYPKDIPSDTVPIKPYSDVIKQSRGVKVVRYQFPIKLAWAITIHSSQGQTLKEAVVSFKDIDFAGQSYVALSRITSSEGLHIIDLDLSKIYCDSGVQQCYNDMTKLNINIQKLPETRELTVVHQNMEGISQHINDLQRCDQLQNSDVLCVTETWSTTSDNIQLPGYTYQGRTRKECYSGNNCKETEQLKTAKHGGVGMFLANSLLWDKNKQVKDVSNKQCSLEHMAVSMSDLQSGMTTIIIVIYRPQILPAEFCCNQLSLLLKSLPSSHRTIIVGDMNKDASKGNSQPLQGLLRKFGFKQLIQQPTTIGANGAILDHVYVQENILPRDQGVIPTHFSYHEAVYVTY